MNDLLQVITTFTGTFPPVIGSPVLRPACPHFVEGWQVIGGIGEAGAKSDRHESDQLMFGMDQRRHTLFTGFVHGVVEDELCLFEVMNTGLIAPAVGSKDE